MSLTVVYQAKLIQETIEDHIALKDFENVRQSLDRDWTGYAFGKHISLHSVLSLQFSKNVVRKIRTSLLEKLLGLKPIFFQKKLPSDYL